MRKNKKNRSGFIYATHHIEKDGWVKVGFTKRAPSKRLSELSGTSVTENFILIDARFVWDCVSCEKYLHSIMQGLYDQKKEFFKAPLQDIASLFDKAELYDLDLQMSLSKLNVVEYNNIDEDYDRLYDDDYEDDQFLDDLGEWKKSDYNLSSTKTDQSLNFKKIEIDAVKGDPKASMFLALSYLKDGVDEKSWSFAQCFFSAAKKQGDHFADLVSLQYRSLWDDGCMEDYWSALSPWYDKIIIDDFIEPEIKELMQKEQNSWVDNPQRAQSFSNWLDGRIVGISKVNKL